MSNKYQMFYKMDREQRPVPCDIAEWSGQVGGDDWRIARSIVGGLDISTIFTGLPMVSLVDDDQYFYETMVFGDNRLLKLISGNTSEDISSIFAKFFGITENQCRYRTVEEARAGHAELVRLAEQVVARLN